VNDLQSPNHLDTVVDVHAHLWRANIDGHTYFSDEAIDRWVTKFGLGGDVPIDVDASQLIEVLDRAEHELSIREYRICVFAIDLRPRFSMSIPLATLNDWVMAQAMRDRRGRILPFACMNPVLEEALDEVRRCTQLGARGFKLYPPTGFYPDDPAAFRFYEAVLEAQQESRRTLPVLVHTGFSYSGSKYAQPIHLEEIASRFEPDLRLIAAHAGIPWTDEAVWLSSIHPNVYLDIALFGDVVGFWSELHARLFATAKRAGAIDRILFGTDWPLAALWLNDCSPRWANLHRVVDAVRSVTVPASMLESDFPQVTSAELIGILGGNARALFGD
jgi:predicted TIM-barrel fold metal-dependent hydrolase